jgi:hypothetical protein
MQVQGPENRGHIFGGPEGVSESPENTREGHGKQEEAPGIHSKVGFLRFNLIRSETNFYNMLNNKVEDAEKIREIDKKQEDKRNARYARRMILDQIKEAQQKIKLKRAEQGIAMNY